MLFYKRILSTSLTLAALFAGSQAAGAVEAAATAAVNVRTGPGTSYAIVDTLHAGEIVDVTECNSSNTWCKIYHTGPDGWVSRSYLGAGPSAGSSGSNVQFGFTFPLPGGGSITFGTPGYTPPSGGGGSVAARVCVYNLANFAGGSTCINAGQSDNAIGGTWNDRITSLRTFGGASIRLCQNTNYGGICNVFSSDQNSLGAALNNKASSYDVLPPEKKRVCVYDLPNYAGASNCVPAGTNDASIPAVWNDKITSIRVFGGASVKLCRNTGFTGGCNTFTSNVPALGMLLNNAASSYQTW